MTTEELEGMIQPYRRYTMAESVISFTTTRAGFVPGQTMTVTIDETTAQRVIDSVSTVPGSTGISLITLLPVAAERGVARAGGGVK